MATMRKLKLQVQMTVDGFVAGPEGQLDWMTRNLGNLVGLHVRPQRDAPRAALLLHPRDVALEHVEIDVEGRGVEVERVH